MEPTDPFYPQLQNILKYGYNPSMEQENGFHDMEPTGSPLTFYDLHIDPNLICKRVVDLTTIRAVLSKMVDDGIDKYMKDGHRFVPSFEATAVSLPTVFRDAPSVADHYELCLGVLASAFASKFYFHPKDPSWSSIFNNAFEFPPGDRHFVIESHLKIFHPESRTYPKKTQYASEADKTKLLDMHERYPEIATWQFYPNTNAARSIVKQMNGGLHFVWKTAGLRGLTNVSSNTVPLDGTKVPRLLLKELTPRPTRNKWNLQGKKEESTLSGPSNNDHPLASGMIQKRSAVVTVFRKRGKTNRPRTDPRHYIQRAWADSVKHDSTFVTFNCGSYERIGIRHRASQTLYLSPMIDTINCQNPHYGKLHIGLHLVIVEDLLQRSDQDDPTHGKKRSANHLDSQEDEKRKRIKTSGSASRAHVDEVARETNKRELVLMTLDYGIHRSPVPATFLRVGSSCHHGLHKPFKPSSKVKFSQTEYFELIVGAPLGHGAVGVVHPAEIVLLLESGHELRHNVVVKLAFTNEQKKKLRHEYSIYSHFATMERPLDTVVPVHGLFEDPDSGTSALLMEDGGQSLRQMKDTLEPEAYKAILAKERESCVNALQEIHRAGVRHRDIRSNNILIDAEHRATIIDFDCSVIDVTSCYRNKFSKEIRRLESLLKGNEVDGMWLS